MDSSSYKDTFKGTAYYYARFRPGYPQWFYDLLCEEFSLDGEGRLLDLGCGTGQIAVPLSGRFQEVVAMDPEPEMLAEARRVIDEAGATNIRLVEGSSADLPALRDALGMFRLVTMGASFHWMDRAVTLEALAQMVEPGGGIVVAGSSTGGSFWSVDTPWCRTVKSTVQKWLGAERRAGSTTFDAAVRPERHEAIIDRSRFGPCRPHLCAYRQVWTVEQVVGCLYSTSYCSPALLGDRQEGFEADLRDALLSLDPAGQYLEDVRVDVLLGKLRD